MKRNFKIAAITCGTVLLCLAAAYWFALRYWTQRTAVIPIQPAEREVMWTGVISTTNGWEFKLENLFDFRKRNAQPIFCEKTRQLFMGFGDLKDDSFYQWDVDKGECVYTFHVGKGFHPSVEAVSPDGKYLVVTRYTSQVTDWKTLIISVEKRSVVGELGDLGAIFETRFSADYTKVWLRTGAHYDGPIVFELDGTPIKSFSAEDFPEIRDRRIWDVPVSKSRDINTGLFFKSSSDVTNLLTTDYWHDNYWITKDGRIIIASNWHDEIVIWDAESAKEIIRQRITNHRNGGGFVIYDKTKDRFLIADPSYQGTTFLRALRVTKQPSRSSQLAN